MPAGSQAKTPAALVKLGWGGAPGLLQLVQGLLLLLIPLLLLLPKTRRKLMLQGLHLAMK